MPKYVTVAFAMSSVLLCFSACSGGSGAPGDAGATAEAGEACDPHGTSGTTYVDSTAAWGLAGVTGNRIASADLDGDGYPDLIIHAIDSNERTTLGTNQLVWVLMNRPNGSGGRMFVDATVDSGLFQVRGGSTTQLRSSQLASIGDVDNDGDLDVFTGTYVDPTNPTTDPGDRSEIMLNDGTGHFTLAPISDPHPPLTDLWPTSAATMADVDHDGKLDLFVAFWYAYYGETYNGVQAQLYHGAGDGTFESITSKAGLTTTANGFAQGTSTRPAYGVTSCDIDGDGYPELMVSAYGRQWNQLYQNDGTGNFTDVGMPSTFAADADLHYADNQFFLCYCTLHATEADCAGVAAPEVECPTPADADWAPGVSDQPWQLGGNNFSTYCGDLDGDGNLDLVNAEIRHWWAGESADPSQILKNTSSGGSISFQRLDDATTGLLWPHASVDWDEGGIMVSGGDLDNDGREDFIIAASDYDNQFGLVFHQKPDGTFEEVGAQWGLHHPCMSGLTIADFDRDGDLDVVVGSGTARTCSSIWKTNEVHFYENTGAKGQGWVQLRLVGDGATTNTRAFGARVTLAAGGTNIVKELQGSHGTFGEQNDTVLSFGVGACTSVDSVTVRWPNQALSTDTYTSLAAGKMYDLHMGDPVAHPIAF